MRMLMLHVTAVMFLSGCATESSSPVCPTLYSYTPDHQARLADEIEAAAPDAVWPGMVADYGAVRAEIRACRAGG